MQGFRQVIDVHLLALARDHAGRLVTFDKALANLGGNDVVLLGL